MLSVRDLHVRYADAEALSGVSLEVNAGEIVALVGANGAGKTSLISAIAGIVTPSAGRVTFEGRDITGLPSHRACNLGIGHVAEGRQLFPNMTVEENLELGAMLPRAKKQRRETLAQVYTMFARLRERRHQLAGTMSGGEQQMLAIGRCLMACPRLIMLDEPSLGLSPSVVKDMFRVIQELNARGVALLVVEQNVAASLRIAARGYVLENGRIGLAGTGEELLHDDRVRAAYLGR